MRGLNVAKGVLLTANEPSACMLAATGPNRIIEMLDERQQIERCTIRQLSTEIYVSSNINTHTGSLVNSLPRVPTPKPGCLRKAAHRLARSLSDGHSRISLGARPDRRRHGEVSEGAGARDLAALLLAVL